MNYDKFAYLYPPRPEQAVSPSMLPFYEKREWLAQTKMNGTCSVIFVQPDRTVFAWNRHNQPHKAWQFDNDSARAFWQVPGDGWCVFVAELLHSKVPGLRNTNYIHDILVDNGEPLVGHTYRRRYNRLTEIFKASDGPESHYVINKNTWLAKNHFDKFGERFAALSKPEEEGLVLKNPDSILRPCFREGVNSGGSVKCRRPTKGYAF